MSEGKVRGLVRLKEGNDPSLIKNDRGVDLINGMLSQRVVFGIGRMRSREERSR